MINLNVTRITKNWFPLTATLLVVCSVWLAGCKKNSSDGPDNTGITPSKPYDSTSLIYYVDGIAGNDANSGKSAGTAWKTIQKACDNATPGSQVFIKGGITYSEQILVNVSGTQDHPIIFSGYGAGDPVLDGTGKTGTVMLSLTNASNLTFSHLVVQHLTVNGAQGVSVTATEQGICSNLFFHHLTIRGINWTTNLSKTPTANDNAQPFIVYGHGLTDANAVRNIGIDSSLVEGNTTGFSECISLDGNITGFSIGENTVQNNSNIGIAVIGNYGTSRTATLDQARNGTISRNSCINNVSAYATSGGIYADGAKDVVIQRNYCSQNGYGIEIGCEENGSASGIKVAGNVLALNKVAGLAIGGYNSATTGQVLDSYVYNNSFYRNSTSAEGTGEIYITKASRCVIGNNLFITDGAEKLMTTDNINPQAEITVDYNDWFSATADVQNSTVVWKGVYYAKFDSYREVTQQEAHSILVDPLVLNGAGAQPDLHLSSFSPIRAKGNPATIQADAGSDFDGKPLLTAGGTTIGAFR